MIPTTPPDTNTPLVIGPNPQMGVIAMLGALEALIGTWNSPRGATATGYNVMPLPQTSAPGGYIVKNFPYYEEITFAPIAGTAPNRGGNLTQTANVLFYEQRVYFADNPQPPPAVQVQDMLVHAENGSWLRMVFGPQVEGPYGSATPNTLIVNPVHPATEYVKQVSVPHGNSILAVGSATVIGNTKPVFPVANRAVLPFTDPTVKDPNTVLQAQLDQLASKGVTVTNTTMITLTTDSAVGGNVSDIHFEQRHATVDRFETTWYIETLNDGTTQLQYSQTMFMKLLIKGVLVDFLHIDANTLVRASQP